MKAPERMSTSPGGLEDRPPSSTRSGGRRRSSLTAVALAAALAIGGGTVAAWEATRGTDRALTTRVERLRLQVADGTVRVDDLRTALARSEARLTSILGPELPDGRHFGYVDAVGNTQRPPRVVFDLAEWFTDRDAVEAALADGVPRQDAGIDGYYIRNENPRWRVLRVAGDATVTLTTYPYADPSAPRQLPMARFAQLFRFGEGTLAWSPYWLTVEDGVVVAIEEQFIP